MLSWKHYLLLTDNMIYTQGGNDIAPCVFLERVNIYTYCDSTNRFTCIRVHDG